MNTEMNTEPSERDEAIGHLSEMLRQICGGLSDLGFTPIDDDEVEAQARAIVDAIANLDDMDEASMVRSAIMEVLFLDAWPEESGRANWWRSSLGRLCGRCLAAELKRPDHVEPDNGSVTRSQAATMLGLTPGTIAQMVARGNLAKHPDGGIDRTAVWGRMGSR